MGEPLVVWQAGFFARLISINESFNYSYTSIQSRLVANKALGFGARKADGTGLAFLNTLDGDAERSHFPFQRVLKREAVRRDWQFLFWRDFAHGHIGAVVVTHSRVVQSHARASMARLLTRGIQPRLSRPRYPRRK